MFDETITSVAPLGSLGLTYDVFNTNQIYTSFATSYTPKLYTDIGNPTSTRVRNADSSVAYNYQGELGARGSYSSWFAYDASVFVNFNTGIVETLNLGAGNTLVNNAGDALYYGAEAAVDLSLTAFIDAQQGSHLRESFGDLTLFANVQLLNAEFTSGQFNGNRPSYSPDYLVKTGVVWDWQDQLKLAFTGQFVDEQFWNDANNNTGNLGAPALPTVNPTVIPAYIVWDLTVEIDAFSIDGVGDFTILGGVSNVFDEQYYSRVRGGSGGIEPLDGRTFYAGARFDF